MGKSLKEINNEIKGYINEAKFISNSCRNKLLKLLGETFSVDLPLENFANIDAQLTENGNIIMRGDEYESTTMVKSHQELEAKYNEFKEKADKLLKKKEINYYTKQDHNNILNLLIIAVIIIVFILLAIHTIKSFIIGNYIHCIWLFMFVSSWLIPSLGIKNRFEQAKNYLKRKFKK